VCRIASFTLVVLGVRRDGQKVLLAVKNMVGESEAAGTEVTTRPYFTLRRHLGNSYLDLLRFFLNHRR